MPLHLHHLFGDVAQFTAPDVLRLVHQEVDGLRFGRATLQQDVRAAAPAALHPCARGDQEDAGVGVAQGDGAKLGGAGRRFRGDGAVWGERGGWWWRFFGVAIK